MRKVESKLRLPDLEDLKITVADYNRASIIKALDNSVSVYRLLRRKLYPGSVILQERAEKEVMEFFRNMKNKKD
jgi:hypothetical protein